MLRMRIRTHITATLAPTLIATVAALLTLFPASIAGAQQAPAAHDALIIKVIGKQWWWEYEYEDSGVVVGNEMHVPLGQPVYLDMVSHDVIHAWWVPKLTGKRDVNSWQRTQLAFTAEEPGTYYGQCTEYCGDSHSLMRIKVVVDTPEDLAAAEEWLATPPFTTHQRDRMLADTLAPALIPGASL